MAERDLQRGLQGIGQPVVVGHRPIEGGGELAQDGVVLPGVALLPVGRLVEPDARPRLVPPEEQNLASGAEGDPSRGRFGVQDRRMLVRGGPRREGPSLSLGRDLRAGDVQQEPMHVEGRHGMGRDSRVHAGRLDEEWNPELLVEDGLAVPHPTVLLELLSVVGEHHRGARASRFGIPRAEQPLQHCVRVPDVAVVLGHRHGEVLGREVDEAVPVDHAAAPGTEQLVPRGLRRVGVVHVHQVQVHEEWTWGAPLPPRPPVLKEPVHHGGAVAATGLQPARDALREAELRRHVPIGGVHPHVVPAVRQRLRKGRQGAGHGVGQEVWLARHLGPCRHVAHPVDGRSHAREERGHRHPGVTGLGPCLLEAQGSPGPAVEEGRGVAGIPVAAEMIGSKGVDEDDEHVGRRLVRSPLRVLPVEFGPLDLLLRRQLPGRPAADERPDEEEEKEHEEEAGRGGSGWHPR